MRLYWYFTSTLSAKFNDFSSRASRGPGGASVLQPNLSSRVVKRGPYSNLFNLSRFCLHSTVDAILRNKRVVTACPQYRIKQSSAKRTQHAAVNRMAAAPIYNGL